MTEDRVVYTPGVCTKCSYTVKGTVPPLEHLGLDSAGRDVFKCPNPTCGATYYVKEGKVVSDDAGA